MKEIALLAVGLIVCSLPVFAGEHLINDTEGTVYGLHVVFSEAVSLVGFGDSLLSVQPTRASTEFTFSGSALEPWGGHWLNWEPTTATIVSYEWLRFTASGETAQWNDGAGTQTYRVEPRDGWWRDILLLSDGSGGQALLNRLSPDAVFWTWAHPSLPNARFMPASGSEFQEVYRVDEKGDAYYDSLEPAMARDLYGDTIPFAAWGGGYYMDPLSDLWSEQVHASILSALTCSSNGVSQDNIGVPPFIKGGGGFTEREKEDCRARLKDTYSQSELKALGLSDIDYFDIADYILENNYLDGNPDALEDPVFRCFVMYQYSSNLAFWADMVKDVLSTVERDVLITGNQHGVWAPYWTNPYSVLLSQVHQVVEIEYGKHIPPWPPAARDSVMYKVGLASGLMEKPVWVRDRIHNDETDEPYLKGGFLRLLIAEACANGAVRAFEPLHITADGEFRLPEATIATVVHYYDWLRDHRFLFERRQSVAKAAIVYSIPSMLWRFFPTTGHRSWPGRLSLSSFALALECEHIPYDVVIFGHPDLWSDYGLAERLSQYDLLILPDVDCLSPYQIDSLRQFLEKGGGIVYSGDLGGRDQDYELRESSALVRLRDDSLVIRVPGFAARDFYDSRLEGTDGADTALAQVMQTIESLSGFRHQIRTNAPDSVSMNPFTIPGEGLTLHFLNYDYNEKTDSLRSPRPFSLELSLPEGFEHDTQGVFFFADNGTSQRLAYTTTGGVLKTTIPSFNCHAVLAIAELEPHARSTLAECESAIGNRFPTTTPTAVLELTSLAQTKVNDADWLGVLQTCAEIRRLCLEAPSVLDAETDVRFDFAHDEQYAASRDDAMRLDSEHPEWVTLTELAVYIDSTYSDGLLTSTVLDGCDVYVIAAPGSAFTQEEVTALCEYVAAGGGLLIIADAGAPPFEFLELGVEFADLPLGEIIHEQVCASFFARDIQPHAVTERICKIHIHRSTTMTLHTEWTVLAQTSESAWQETSRDGHLAPGEPRGPFPLLAIREYGQGRVAAVSDEFPFGEEGDAVLIANLIRWLAGR